MPKEHWRAVEPETQELSSWTCPALLISMGDLLGLQKGDV
jgi:hypothetical protein